MPQGVVNRSLSDFAAMDVRDRNLERQRGQCRGEHFKAITEHQQDVRATTRVGLGEADNPEPNGLGNSVRRIRRQQHLDAVAYLKTIGLNRLDGETELRREVHPRNQEIQLEFRFSCNAPQDGQVYPVVGTSDGDRADRSHASISNDSSVPAGIFTRAVRPRSCDNIAGARPVPGRITATSAAQSTVPLVISRPATKLLRATAAVFASLAAGSLRPWPNAASTIRMPRTSDCNSRGSS